MNIGGSELDWYHLTPLPKPPPAAHHNNTYK